MYKYNFSNSITTRYIAVHTNVAVMKAERSNQTFTRRRPDRSLKRDPNGQEFAGLCFMVSKFAYNCHLLMVLGSPFILIYMVHINFGSKVQIQQQTVANISDSEGLNVTTVASKIEALQTNVTTIGSQIGAIPALQWEVPAFVLRIESVTNLPLDTSGPTDPMTKSDTVRHIDRMEDIGVSGFGRSGTR
jgi:hypothetical protein